MFQIRSTGLGSKTVLPHTADHASAERPAAKPPFKGNSMPINVRLSRSILVLGLTMMSVPVTASAQSVDGPRLLELAQRGPDGERGRRNDEDGDKKRESRSERGKKDRDSSKSDRPGGRDAKQAREPKAQKEKKKSTAKERDTRRAPSAAKAREPKRDPSAAEKKREFYTPGALPRKEPARKKANDAVKRQPDKKAQQAKDRAEKEKADKARAQRRKQERDADQKRQARPDPKDRRSGPPAARKADQDRDRDRKHVRDRDRDRGPDRKSAARGNDRDRFMRFEDVRKKRTERKEGGRKIIIEPDNRKIVRRKNRTIIRHDDNRRLRRSGREVRRERQKDGTWLIVTAGLAGALIYSLQDDDGRLLRRSRRDERGREHVLFDNRRHYYEGRGPSRRYDPHFNSYIDLPPPRVSIPRDEYVVEYDGASVDDIYDALEAPPVEELDRRYSLDEVRYSYDLLERMRRVDLDAVNFEFGSWEITPDQYPKLERVADAIHRLLQKSPDEVFLLEGHTDAVGSDIDNLSLSDRRAESVAIALTEEFEIPPENLMTQGYGEYHLKADTQEASRINRRVAIRRITPLLDREGWSDDVSGR